MALPREGHLDTMFHIFAYLKRKHNMRTVLDPLYPDIDMSVFHDCNWRQYHGDVKERLLLLLRNEEKKWIYNFMSILIMLARRKLDNQGWDSSFS